MKCEICDGDVPVISAESDGVRGQVNHYFCLDCAQRTGLPISAGLADVTSRLLRRAQFFRANNRMPTPGELPQLGGTGEMPSTQPGTSEFEDQVRSLEAVADFMERHGRPPTDEEVPDPFDRRG